MVAAALFEDTGKWLMHRRPAHKHHGGLWEFPGGKVESGERPRDALLRELREELGITVERDALIPVSFAEEAVAVVPKPIVILLYKSPWDGAAPRALEGGEVAWFTPAGIGQLAKPPLDIALARHLFEKV